MKTLTRVLALMPLIVGCGNYSDAWNAAGDPIIQSFPFAVKVAHPGTRGFCTGTLIGPRAVLTAAHCLGMTGRYYILSRDGLFETADFEVMPNGEDLAVLRFEETIAPAEATLPIGGSVASGDEVRLVGVGCDSLADGSGADRVRTGTNRVRGTGKFLTLHSPLAAIKGILGAENTAGICWGDSGGPAARRSPEGDWSLVGVAHGVARDELDHVSYFVDVTKPGNRAFLEDIEARFALGIRFNDRH